MECNRIYTDLSPALYKHVLKVVMCDFICVKVRNGFYTIMFALSRHSQANHNTPGFSVRAHFSASSLPPHSLWLTVTPSRCVVSYTMQHELPDRISKSHKHLCALVRFSYLATQVLSRTLIADVWKGRSYCYLPSNSD